MENNINHQGLAGTLGLEMSAEGSGESTVARGEVRVTEALSQPYGLCAGGTMLTLEETLAGVGSQQSSDEELIPLGIQVSANHIKSVPVGGLIRGEARVLKLGYRTHIWDVTLYDETGDIVSTARVVNAIKRIKRAPAAGESSEGNR